MMDFGFGMLGLGALVMVAFWVLVIGGAVWLLLALARGNQGPLGMNPPPSLLPSSAPSQAPLDILKVRYAKGEITKEQFEQMKRDLDI